MVFGWERRREKAVVDSRRGDGDESSIGELLPEVCSIVKDSRSVNSFKIN